MASMMKVQMICCCLLPLLHILHSYPAVRSVRRARHVALHLSDNGEDNRPPILPFDFGADFARADVIVKSVTVKNTANNLTAGSVPETNVRTDLEVDQSTDDSSNIFDVLFSESSKDSKDKRQARFTIRSITILSILMGVIFTGIWYLFPGKFVSYRGNADYPPDEQNSLNRIHSDDSTGF